MNAATPKDLGALIRSHRMKQGLTQQDLATRIGVERKWIIGLESGKARAELHLVMRAIDALGLSLNLTGQSETNALKPLE